MPSQFSIKKLKYKTPQNCYEFCPRIPRSQGVAKNDYQRFDISSGETLVRAWPDIFGSLDQGQHSFVVTYTHTILAALQKTEHSRHLYAQFVNHDPRTWNPRIAEVMRYVANHILPDIGCEINGDTPNVNLPIIDDNCSKFRIEDGDQKNTRPNIMFAILYHKIKDSHCADEVKKLLEQDPLYRECEQSWLLIPSCLKWVTPFEPNDKEWSVIGSFLEKSEYTRTTSGLKLKKNLNAFLQDRYPTLMSMKPGTSDPCYQYQNPTDHFSLDSFPAKAIFHYEIKEHLSYQKWNSRVHFIIDPKKGVTGLTVSVYRDINGLYNVFSCHPTGGIQEAGIDEAADIIMQTCKSVNRRALVAYNPYVALELMEPVAMQMREWRNNRWKTTEQTPTQPESTLSQVAASDQSSSVRDRVLIYNRTAGQIR